MSENWLTRKVNNWAQRQAEVMNSAVDQALDLDDFNFNELENRIVLKNPQTTLQPTKPWSRIETTKQDTATQLTTSLHVVKG